jgi:hypothetical protein
MHDTLDDIIYFVKKGRIEMAKMLLDAEIIYRTSQSNVASNCSQISRASFCDIT